MAQGQCTLRGMQDLRKAGNVLVLWTFWPCSFRKAAWAHSPPQQVQISFGGLPGFQISQLLGDDPTFYLAGYEQLKDTGGPYCYWDLPS